MLQNRNHKIGEGVKKYVKRKERRGEKMHAATRLGLESELGHSACMLDKSHLAASHSGWFDNQAFLWLTATTIIAKSLLEMVSAIFFSTGTWACKGLKIKLIVFVLFCFFLTTGSLEGKWVSPISKPGVSGWGSQLRKDFHTKWFRQSFECLKILTKSFVHEQWNYYKYVTIKVA